MDASIIAAAAFAWLTMATLFAIVIGRTAKVGDQEARLEGARLRSQAGSEVYQPYGSSMSAR